MRSAFAFTEGLIRTTYITAVVVLAFLLFLAAYTHPVRAAGLRIKPVCTDQADQSGEIHHQCTVPGAPPLQRPQQPQQPVQPPALQPPPRYQPSGRAFPGGPETVYGPPPAPPPVAYGPGFYINPSAGVYRFGPLVIQAPPIYVQPPIPVPPANPNPIGWVDFRLVHCDAYGQNCFVAAPFPASGVNVRTGPGQIVTGAFVNGLPITLVGPQGYWAAVQAQCSIIRIGWSDSANVPLLGCAAQ